MVRDVASIGGSVRASGLAAAALMACVWAHAGVAQPLSIPPDVRIPGPPEVQVERPVAVVGDTMLLGYPGSAQNLTETGAVHVYGRGTGTCGAAACWTFVRSLQPSRPAPGLRFGASIAFDGATVVIGAPSVVAGEEAVYVYARRSGEWVLSQVLRGDVSERPTNFGRRVALDGNTLAVASVGYGVPGVVHLFSRDDAGNWQRSTRVAPPDALAEDQFGQSLSLHSGTLIVGANQAPLADGAGAAHIFRQQDGQWRLQQKLTAADGAAGDNFGHAVALWRDTALVTSHVADYGKVGPDTYGVAYLYAREGDSWRSVRKLFPVADVSWQGLGTGIVALEDGIAMTASRAAENDGAIYWFSKRNGTWADVRRYWVPDPPQPLGLASDGRTLVVATADAAWVWDLDAR